MIEYELLKIIWWVLVGVLLIGFALTDGFDMGSMALMPFVGKTDKNAVLQSIRLHRTGMVTKFGLLLLVVHFLLHGQWFMLSLSLGCIGPYYSFYLPFSSDLLDLTIALNLENTKWRTLGTGVFVLVVLFQH
jgi:cytochrome d ubiquinol oxidase subunit II